MTRTTHGDSSAPPQLVAADATSIADIMTRDPVVVHAELAIEDLVAVFLEQGISQAPVVGDDDKPIGIVSKTDLVTEQYMRGDTDVDQRGVVEPGLHVHEVGGIVRDVMTPIAFSLPASISIGAASRRMLADNIHAAPVIADDGHVIGILSATDVMAWVAGL